MKNLSKKLFLFLFISITAFACSEDDTITPEIPQIVPIATPTDTTTIGQDFYITGKADGISFISRDDNRFTYAKLFLSSTIRQHQLIGTGDNTGAASLMFQKKDGAGFDGVGRYDFANNANAGLSFGWIPGNVRITYACDNNSYNDGFTDGFVDVTFYDTTIVAGTFAFTAIDQANTSDKVTITDGRFRLKYK